MKNRAELARIVWFRARPKLSLDIVSDVLGASNKSVVDLGGVGLKAAKVVITAARRRRRGRRPGDAIEFDFGGLPERDGNDAWPETRVHSWADANVKWVGRLMGPQSVIVAAALHQDGASPRTRVLVVPIVDGELGWTRIRDRAVETFTAAFGIYSPTRYAALANAYLLEVGSAFGLGSVDLEALAEAAAKHRVHTLDYSLTGLMDRIRRALHAVHAAEARLAAARSNEDALANATHYRDRVRELEDELASVKTRADENERRYRVEITAEDKLRTEHQQALTAAVRAAKARERQFTVVALIRALRAHEQRAGRTFAPELAAVLDACEDGGSLVPLDPPDDARDGAIEDEVSDDPTTLGPRDGGAATGVEGAVGGIDRASKSVGLAARPTDADAVPSDAEPYDLEASLRALLGDGDDGPPAAADAAPTTRLPDTADVSDHVVSGAPVRPPTALSPPGPDDSQSASAAARSAPASCASGIIHRAPLRPLDGAEPDDDLAYSLRAFAGLGDTPPSGVDEPSVASPDSVDDLPAEPQTDDPCPRPAAVDAVVHEGTPPVDDHSFSLRPFAGADDVFDPR